MTDAIVQWLLSAGEGKFLATVLISMLPVIELRGGLPAADTHDPEQHRQRREHEQVNGRAPVSP